MGPQERGVAGSPPANSGSTAQNGHSIAGKAWSPEDPAIGYPPTRFWRSVRVRILLPVALALTGLVVLGFIQERRAERALSNFDG